MRLKSGSEVGNFPSKLPCPACTHHRDQGSLNLQGERLYHILDGKWPRTKKERVERELSLFQPTTRT